MIQLLTFLGFRNSNSSLQSGLQSLAGSSDFEVQLLLV
uniref:Uncharacterized protein n=1 Tax=Setaria italica TaxID=4555 RepID=K4A410_SETIT